MCACFNVFYYVVDEHSTSFSTAVLGLRFIVTNFHIIPLHSRTNN